MKVAVCDDNREFCEKERTTIKDVFKQYFQGEDCQVDIYNDGQTIINNYSDTAATYESSKGQTVSSATSKSTNPSLVAQLKADSDNRMQQLQSLVTTMFKKQGITIGTADDMWKALAGGNFTADADTIAQAKEDISENGYWGVKQTSERIFSFAQALAGDDEEKMTKMKEAFEKGFKEATKTWGKKLPDISQNTRDAVLKKFDDYFAGKNS